MSDSYFIKRGEAINGPFTLKKVQKALSDKKLKAADLIAVSNEGPWEQLSSVFKDIRAGKAPRIADEKPDAESIIDEWMADGQPAPVKPPPEIEGSSPQADSYSLPSQSPEIVAEHDDDDGDEIDDQPLPTAKVSTTSTDVADEVQSESRQSRLKAINPIAAAAIAAAGIVVVGMVVVLLARAAGFQRGDAIEYSYLPSGLSENELAKAFAGIYQYEKVGEERPDGSIDKTSTTIYFIHAPGTARQGVFYRISNEEMSAWGSWGFNDCKQIDSGKEYLAELWFNASSNMGASGDLFEVVNPVKEVEILEDRYKNFDTNYARRQIGDVYDIHKVGSITDDMLERVEIPKSGMVTYKLKKYPNHRAE